MKIYVVGLGPGDISKATDEAIKALENCDIIAGYTVYIDLIREKFAQKEFLQTPMKQEVLRCEMARDAALSGKTVAMVCSGDSGVYGMAGLMLEVCENFPEIDVEIVSGVTAALSGGAVLGAPLMHDFCVISLSDLLTPMELIKKRLECAAKGDFSLVLYNPSSKKRHDYIKIACEILLKDKSPNTVCGVVRNIGREGESFEIMTLEDLKNYTELDMFCTVFIGNSMTKVINNRMVTPRGYKI